MWTPFMITGLLVWVVIVVVQCATQGNKPY